ncbi:NAD(P)-dependent oxidoreductase [Melittangium boletus]|uniref:NAD(P)-dependent oxidoreductase n=1 Tax=Melittangium boletus TaxID=83453 RepID=UPI003DA44010
MRTTGDTDTPEQLVIAVCGATGATGRHVVDLALLAGHRVRVSARTPSKLAQSHARLEVLQGDAFDRDHLTAVFEGCDVVVSCLGVKERLSDMLGCTFYRETSSVIMDAMAAAGVERLLAITSAGVEHEPESPLWYRGVVRPLLMQVYIDMQRMEQQVEATGIDWTFVRPTFLRPGGATGRYRVRDRRWPSDGWRVGVGDVAHFMVTELRERAWSRRHPVVAV